MLRSPLLFPHTHRHTKTTQWKRIKPARGRNKNGIFAWFGGVISVESQRWMSERLPVMSGASTHGGDAAPSASPTQTAPTEVRSAPRPTHWLDNMALAHVSIPQVLEASEPIPGRLVQARRLWLAAARSKPLVNSRHTRTCDCWQLM